MEKSVLLERIEALNVKESWKQKFRLYVEAGIKFKFGFQPEFENMSVLKGKFGMLKSYSNIFGFLFGFFYYIYLGMYKKAGLIFFIWTLFNVIVGMLTDELYATNLFAVIFLFYLARSVNFDFYRKKVLGENFWW